MNKSDLIATSEFGYHDKVYHQKTPSKVEFKNDSFLIPLRSPYGQPYGRSSSQSQRRMMIQTVTTETTNEYKNEKNGMVDTSYTAYSPNIIDKYNNQHQ